MKKILLLLISINAIAQTPICFNVTSTVSTGTYPQDVITADFNNDIKIDLAVTNSGSSNISVITGLGNGFFNARTNYTVGANPQGITSGDFNNDGHTDLAVAVYNTHKVALLLGSSSGTFAPSVIFSAGTNPQGIVSGDFNNDGNLDVAVTNHGSNTISILIGNGTGSFATAVNYPVGNGPAVIRTIDFNSDGKLDLVVGHFTGTDISVLMGGNAGVFSSAVSYAIGFNNVTGLICKDMDADAKLDVMVSTTGQISFFKGSGTATFAAAVHNTPVVQPYQMVCEDFNADGVLDLAISEGGSTLKTYTLSSTAVTTAVGSYSTTDDYSGIASADFNGDGKTDLALASYGHGLMTILLNGIPNVQVVSTNSLICKGNNSTLIASGAATYSWSTGATTNSITVNPLSTTAYTLNGVGVNGCSATVVSSVTVNALPTITITSTSSVLCSGNAAILSATGATSYTWNTGVISNTISINPTTTTPYTVSVLDANGCANTASITQQVSLCTGLEAHSKAEDLAVVYPNPSLGTCDITLTTSSHVILMNSLGQIIQEDSLETGAHAINIQHAATGIYFVKIVSGNQQQLIKLIKN